MKDSPFPLAPGRMGLAIVILTIIVCRYAERPSARVLASECDLQTSCRDRRIHADVIVEGNNVDLHQRCVLGRCVPDLEQAKERSYYTFLLQGRGSHAPHSKTLFRKAKRLEVRVISTPRRQHFGSRPGRQVRRRTGPPFQPMKISISAFNNRDHRKIFNHRLPHATSAPLPRRLLARRCEDRNTSANLRARRGPRGLLQSPSPRTDRRDRRVLAGRTIFPNWSRPATKAHVV